MENAKTLQTLTIFTKQIEKDGKKFFVYSYKSSDGKWYNVKFTQAVKNAPDEKGYRKINFYLEDMSIEKAQKEAWSDTIWINSLISHEEDKEKFEEIRRNKVAEYKEIFK